MGRIVQGGLLLAALLGALSTPLLAENDAEGVYDSTEDSLSAAGRDVPSDANDAEDVYATTEEALDELRSVENPGSSGDSVEAIISQFFPEEVVDEGTYPLSEAIERDFELRRTFPAEWAHSGRFYTKYSDDNISGVEKWEKEFELNLNYKDFSSYFRFGDVSAFAYEEKPLRFEKARADYRWDGGRVTAGSFGELFARGLALNMFEERFLDFDNEIEGLRVRQEVGDAELTALRGTRKLRSEPRHAAVSAFRVQTPVGDSVDVGVHVVQVEYPHLGGEAAVKVELDIAGADVSWRPGDFRFFGEVVGVERQPTPGGTPADEEGLDGLGYYATGVYSIPGFSLAGEYKNYRLIGHPFNVLPPVRRWQEKSSADPNDDIGYSFTMNLSPSDDGSMFSAVYSQDSGKAKGRPYTELLASYSGPTGGRTHYVLERWYVNDLIQKHDFERATVSHVIDPDWTAAAFLERERLRPFFGDPYYDWLQYVEVAFQSKFAAVFTVEYTGVDQPPEIQSRWKLFEVKYAPDHNQEFNLMLGSRREGFVCSGGICRLEPAFSGVRLDYLFRF